MSAYGGMSNNDTHIASEISSVDELDVLDDNKNVVDCIESGQIIFKLAEEIRSLREVLLNSKQEKRLLLVANDSLQDEISQLRKNVDGLKLALRLKDDEVFAVTNQLEKVVGNEKLLHTTVVKNQSYDAELKIAMSSLQDLAFTEKKKNKVLSLELEKSLEDEMSLRRYCARLESELNEARAQHRGAETLLAAEVRSKCTMHMEMQHMMKLVGVSESELASVGTGVRNGNVDGRHSQHYLSSSLKYNNTVLHTPCCQQCGMDPEVFPLVRKKVAKFVAAYRKEKGNVKKLLEVVKVYESMEAMMALSEKEQQANKSLLASQPSRVNVSSVFGMVDSEYVSGSEE